MRPEGFFQENFAFALAVAWKYYPWEPTEFEGLSASAGQAVDVNEVLHLIYLLSLLLSFEKSLKRIKDYEKVRAYLWLTLTL